MPNTIGGKKAFNDGKVVIFLFEGEEPPAGFNEGGLPFRSREDYKKSTKKSAETYKKRIEEDPTIRGYHAKMSRAEKDEFIATHKDDYIPNYLEHGEVWCHDFYGLSYGFIREVNKAYNVHEMALERGNEKRKNTFRNKPKNNVQHKRKPKRFKKRKTGTCLSSIEQRIFDFLKSYYGNDMVIYNEIIDDRYPFHCDFYIKPEDLFIEINAHWTHGIHPFNNSNDNDLKELEIWTAKSGESDYYQSAVRVWTGSDPMKYETAKANNLKYIRLYPSVSLDENLEINNNNFPDMIKLLYENRI